MDTATATGRASYDVDEWAAEVFAVIEAEALVKPTVVGHSMGGWVAVSVGSLYADRISAIAILDSPLNDQPPEEESLRQRMRPTRVYPTVEAALARFTTLPTQDLVLPYVEDHVAAQSLRSVDGGWTWKFDPRFFGRRVLLRHSLPRLGLPGGTLPFRARPSDSGDGRGDGHAGQPAVRDRRHPRSGPSPDARPATVPSNRLTHAACLVAEPGSSRLMLQAS